MIVPRLTAVRADFRMRGLLVVAVVAGARRVGAVEAVETIVTQAVPVATVAVERAIGRAIRHSQYPATVEQTCRTGGRRGGGEGGGGSWSAGGWYGLAAYNVRKFCLINKCASGIYLCVRCVYRRKNIVGAALFTKRAEKGESHGTWLS